MIEERRNPEITSLKERVTAIEKETEKLERLATGMNYALFGIPEDRTNNGLVGTMAEMKRTLNFIWVSVLVAGGANVIVRYIAG